MNPVAKRPPSADCEEAWASATHDVHPLGGKRGKHPPRKSKPPLPSQSFIPPSQRHQAIPILSNTADCLAALASNQSPQRLKDLRLGKPSPTAVLDLHGFKEGDAWLKLNNWLAMAVAEDHRCVLIITGKGRGYGPEANMGVIKAQVAVWLAAHPEILGFHTALPRDGGTGAIYVLLRRHGGDYRD